MSTNVDGPARPGRLGWVDAGRGTAVLLVVLFHSTNWLVEAGYAVAWWKTVSELVASLRLPLFFTLAGLFAQKWVAGPWRSLWSGKLSLFLWVYALWSVIATFSFMLGMDMQDQRGNYLHQLTYLVRAPLFPRFELWFIWALTVLFVVSKVVRRLPIWVQLAVAGALSAVTLSATGVTSAGPVGAARYAFFFLLGLHGRARLISYSSMSRRIVLLAVVGVWVVVAVLGTVLHLNTTLPGYYFVACCLGVLAGINISRLLAGVATLRRVGSQTLPIYLSHTTLILIACWCLHFIGAGVKSHPGVGVLPPVLAASAAMVALRLAGVAERLPVARNLYLAPQWLVDLPARLASFRGGSGQATEPSDFSSAAPRRRARSRRT